MLEMIFFNKYSQYTNGVNNPELLDLFGSICNGLLYSSKSLRCFMNLYIKK
jgi:hypothetical protein